MFLETSMQSNESPSVTKRSINRIVIGDVGSGKTIVAFLVALTYLRSLATGQVALLAPTEVLAFQHYQGLNRLLNSLDDSHFSVSSIFLTSKSVLFNGEKTTATKLAKFLNENPQTYIFWVGTQALLHSQLIKPDMVLVDEQHRFGVRQRQLLTQQQTQLTPHFISFTATPIPRTLALTVYKQLQPHFLETLASRNPIITKVQPFEQLPNIIHDIKQEIQKNRKVYIICPQVESGEEPDDEIWSVKRAQIFFEQYFPNQTLLVHGKDKQKKDVLQQFKDDQTKPILVSTTVIEVGVDVAAATMVVIFNAERFGLSALHQIRGRVGRNDDAHNYCILLTPKQFAQKPRLQALVRLNNGFDIAEEDLKLRGSGDVIGQVQSGFGSDIDEIIGLNPELYEKLSSLADSVDIENLPRLKNYVQQQASKVWAE